MKIIILGYSGLIGNSILEKLAKNTSLDLVCVGRNIKNRLITNSRIKYFSWDFVTFKKSNLLFLKKVDIIINCVGKIDNNTYDLKNINVTFIRKLLKYINSYQSKIRLIHLSSVAVYGQNKKNVGQYKVISENNAIKSTDLYSKSKIKGDLLIQNFIKKSLNKNFSYTILRISNVFGSKKKTNLIKFVIFSLKFRFWIKCYNDIIFNFINVKDVVQAIELTISRLKISKNKTYIVSDDCRQYQLYKNHQKFYKKKIKKVLIPISFIKFIIYLLPIPKKIMNFILLISNRVNYSNEKIKKELNFKPRFSIFQKIKLLNE
jgi:nucleoside-diphosphate-sugar epimerase